MRPPKTLCLAVLVALLPQLAGCYSYRSYEGGVQRLRTRTVEESPLRITTVNGERVRTRSLTIGTTHLFGQALTPADAKAFGAARNVDDPYFVSIPFEEIQSVEQRHFDLRKTTLGAIAVGALTYGLFALAMSGNSYGPLG
jgi:hypothetical protein